MKKDRIEKNSSKTMTAHNRLKNRKLADRYLGYLHENRTNEKTIKTFSNGIKKHLAYLGEKDDCNVKDVIPETIKEFRIWLQKKQFSVHTVDVYLRATKQFYSWLAEQSIIFMNPAENLLIPKPSRKLGMVLTEQEIDKILSAPDLSTPSGIRDRALLETAYSTAARIAELAGLSVDDVNFENQTIKVLGKFSKERVIPIGEHAVKWLQHYIENARVELLKNSDCKALWISRLTGDVISLDGLSQRFRHIGRRAGISHFTCHTFRRTCATAMLRNGAQPEVLRQFLGHSSMKTLAQYLLVSINDIRNMHAASKPGS